MKDESPKELFERGRRMAAEEDMALAKSLCGGLSLPPEVRGIFKEKKVKGKHKGGKSKKMPC